MTKKRNKLFARFKCLNPQYRGAVGPGREVYSIRHQCGYCVHCMRNNLNDLIAKVAAHSLICTHVDFWTLSYDGSKGVEERVAAKIRVQRHAQNWQKRLRAREAYGLQKYNERETELAELENRPALLVDASRSYLKFLTVPEIGDKGRCHFHAVVLWESHFPVPDEIIATGDILRTREHTQRVWDLEEMTGPVTPDLPAGANDPAVIDFRVRAKKLRVSNGPPRKTGGNQLHVSWPHGFVNIQRLTHDCNVEGPPALKPVTELADGIRYVQKYLKKWKQGKDLTEKQKRYSDEDWLDFKAGLRPGVVRSHSRGLGHDYARVFGRSRAVAGVPLADLAFHLEGFNVKRSHVSVVKYQAGMGGRSEASKHALTQYRQTFLMRGAMASVAVSEYMRVRKMRGKNELPPDELVVAKTLFEQVTDEYRKYLGSARAKVARTMSPLLLDVVPACRMFDRGPNGLELDGQEGREIAYRCPWERLTERRACFEKTKEQFEAVLAQFSVSERFERVKREVSRVPVEKLCTEWQFRNRPSHEVSKFKRKFDLDHVRKVLDQIERRAELGDPDADEELAWIQNELVVTERAEFGLPRHDLWHELAHSDVLWRWINHSDDYHFPEMRDQLVRRYCDVSSFDGYELVRPPNGGLFLRRPVLTDRRMFVREDGQETHFVRLVRDQTVMACRRIAAGDPPVLRSTLDRDAIFSGPEPLKAVSASLGGEWGALPPSGAVSAS